MLHFLKEQNSTSCLFPSIYNLKFIFSFASCLIGYATGINEKISTKCMAASALWAFLYNHQGIKASLNKENVKNELELNKLEYEREIDKNKYQQYHNVSSSDDELKSVQLLVTSLANILSILGN